MAAELMETWLRGYCLARELTPPERIPGGFWLEVAKPQQAGRYILKRFNPAAILTLIDLITEPAVYIEFPGVTAQALPILPEGWSIRDDAYLMDYRIRKIDGIEAEDVPGYRFDLRGDLHGVTVEVRTEAGDLAGRGCFGAFGQVAVFDQISIEPQYRRQGLATSVMVRLTRAAGAAGAVQGLLIATDEGRALYAATGWRHVSHIVSMISHFDSDRGA